MVEWDRVEWMDQGTLRWVVTHSFVGPKTKKLYRYYGPDKGNGCRLLVYREGRDDSLPWEKGLVRGGQAYAQETELDFITFDEMSEWVAKQEGLIEQPAVSDPVEVNQRWDGPYGQDDGEMYGQ